MVNLKDLAPGYSGRLCAANDIDDHGRITGEAMENGTSVPFVATPR
jgi:hypothetical protein